MLGNGDELVAWRPCRAASSFTERSPPAAPFEVGVQILWPELAPFADTDCLQVACAKQSVDGRSLDAENVRSLVDAEHRCGPKRPVVLWRRMGHADMKAAVGPGSRKVDADFIRKAAARRAALLQESILAGNSNCRSALGVLFDHFAHVLFYDQEDSGSWVFEAQGKQVIGAAETVLVGVQEQLLRRREFSIDEPERGVRFELAFQRHGAIRALKDRMVASEAKRLDLNATGPRPLTVCIGADLKRSNGPELPCLPFLGGKVIEVPMGDLGSAHIPVPPCFRVFEDTTQTSRHPWVFWCRDCSARRTRDAEKATKLHRQRFGIC